MADVSQEKMWSNEDLSSSPWLGEYRVGVEFLSDGRSQEVEMRLVHRNRVERHLAGLEVRDEGQ